MSAPILDPCAILRKKGRLLRHWLKGRPLTLLPPLEGDHARRRRYRGRHSTFHRRTDPPRDQRPAAQKAALFIAGV